MKCPFFYKEGADLEKNDNKARLFFLTAFLLIIFDQLTKISVKGFNLFGFKHEGFYLGEAVEVWGDFIQFTFVENAGMAFGISFGAAKIFLSLFSVFASIALGIYLYKIRFFHPGVKTGIMLIFAGAVGNLIDRVFYGVFYGESPIFYGKVVDFVQVDIPDVDFLGLYYTHFPVFNVADSCVTVGVVFLLLFNSKIPSFSEVFPKKKDGDVGTDKLIDDNDENARNTI